MTADIKRRQKRVEAKKAKRKAKHKVKRRLSTIKVGRLLHELPFVSCHIPSREHLEECGVGVVVAARRLDEESAMVASILLDTFCLGVKDAFLVPMSSDALKDMLEELSMQQECIPTSPAAAKHLVQSAVRYAESLGLSPHSDYEEAFSIFNGITAQECFEGFSFGKGGKPLYVAALEDNEVEVERVLTNWSSAQDPALNESNVSNSVNEKVKKKGLLHAMTSLFSFPR